MMNMKRMTLLTMCSVAALLGGCGGDDDDKKNNNGGSATEEVLEGSILSDKTLTADKTWILKGIVNVGNGSKEITSTAIRNGIKEVTLTIEPGTNIVADQDGTLIINRGSKLMAEGTAAKPITFSSQQDDDYDGLGEWGGIIVQGFAPQYAPGTNEVCHLATGFCNVQGEGGDDTVKYFGGDDEADNSGVIKFVRIAEAGKVAGANNEINGLTLQGVGHGTTIDYVQVHNNLDDGIEWFGGTVNATHLVLTGNDDDDIDFDEGYKGNIQFAIIHKAVSATVPQGSNDPRGIEANSSDDEAVPATEAVLSNITIVGSDITSGTSSQPAMRLRGDVNVKVHNSAVSYYNGDCLRVDNGMNESTDVTFDNILVGSCGTVDKFFKLSATGSASGTGVKPNPAGQSTVTQKPENAPLGFDSAFAVSDADAQLGFDVSPVAVNNGSGFAFQSTNYIGAVNPNSSVSGRDWWSSWTLPNSVNVPVVETLQGDILASKTLKANTVYLLKGIVNVGDGAKEITSQVVMDAIKNVTLTIEPGTHILADQDGTLIINRGSKLMAEGTASRPITFSSQMDDDYDGLGEWGGIIIQGYAPQYGLGTDEVCHHATGFCNVQGEGGDDTVKYFGGDDLGDNSGTIKYLRVAEAGKVAGANNEINGLTLQGVGYGTTLEYIQVHNNLDDGIEWFGGAVNAKYLVLTGNDDDDIDFDEGYKGNIQYALIIKDPDATAPQGSNDPRGIEANSSDDHAVVATEASLANITIIGSDITSGASEQPAMRLRGDVTVAVHNSVVSNYNGVCLRVDNGMNEATDVTFNNLLVGDCGTLGTFFKLSATGSASGTGVKPAPAGQSTVLQNAANAALAFNSRMAVTDAAALLGAPAVIGAVNNGSGFVFDQTSYMGAVDPAAATAWWSGWTLKGSVQ